MAMSQMYLAACKPVEILSRQGGVSARLECKCCGGHEDWGLTKVPPPDIIHKHFKTKGWCVEKRPTCPECLIAKKRKPDMTKAPANPLQFVKDIAENLAAASPSGDAKAARREAHDMIAMCFDIPTGRYNDGYSDQRIADESGVAVAWVKQRREEEFGLLKTPREYSELQERLALVLTRQRDLEIDVEDIKAKMDGLSKRNGWQ